MPTKKTLVSASMIAFGLTALTQTVSAAVVGNFQFNDDGVFDGWNANNTPNAAVSGGTLNGTASGNDPQLLLNPAGLTTTDGWDTLEFRVRETQDEAPAGLVSEFNPTGVVVIISTTLSPNNSLSFVSVDSGDGFFTVTADISSLGTADITNIRVDPIGGASGNSNSQTDGNFYEVDFITISEVPEPSSLALIGLGSLAMIRRRR